jgi:Zn-dependent peptidase ImmA (M78 family)
MKICSKAGVAVIFAPEIPGTRVYGATRWLTPAKSLIQLSLRGKSDDHLWFTFFHESAHILIHGKKNVFIEADDREGQNLANAEKEKEADKFAQEFLIPVNEYKEFARKNIFSHTSIREFARKLGIAPGIVVGRLQHDSIIQYSQFNDLKNRFRFAEA